MTDMKSVSKLPKQIINRKIAELSHYQENLRNSIFDSFRASFSHPILWVSLALLANILEGAVRKWVPGFEGGAGRAFAYFSKDMILIGVAVLVGLGRSSKRRPNQAEKLLVTWGRLALGLICFGALVSSFEELNPVGAVLTLRSLIVLPVAAFILGTVFAGRFPLLGFAFLTVLLALGNGFLSLIQNSLPSSHALNQYAADGVLITEVAYGVRATGTFAYISGLGVAAALGVWAGMVMISLARSFWQRFWGATGILAGLACAFASISRGSVVIVFAMLGLWVLGSVRTSRFLAKGALATGAAILIALLLMPSVVDRFLLTGEGALDRFESAGDSNFQRTIGQWEEMVHAVRESPMGAGLGTEQVGGNFVAKGKMSFTTYESQFPRIVLETGVLGLLGFLVLVAAVVFALQMTKKGSGGARWNLVATATQVFLLGQFYGSLAFNHTASAAIWLVATAVFAAMPRDQNHLSAKPSRV